MSAWSKVILGSDVSKRIYLTKSPRQEHPKESWLLKAAEAVYPLLKTVAILGTHLLAEKKPQTLLFLPLTLLSYSEGTNSFQGDRKAKIPTGDIWKGAMSIPPRSLISSRPSDSLVTSPSMLHQKSIAAIHKGWEAVGRAPTCDFVETVDTQKKKQHLQKPILLFLLISSPFFSFSPISIFRKRASCF
ncbi:uncharacterized protein LOC113459790 isoform X2 [Zonotrichia albicollis]|uniref:uncharacterized protein LOC113459790 isoform X2 n=1 Tax=Zonotrichia albicollis TaxID=44394 RepID=UPI003D810919